MSIAIRPARRVRPAVGGGLPLMLLAALTTGRTEPPASAPSVSSPPASSPAPPTGDAVPEVVVAAPEPRYVAPTRRDSIGRVWAPVLINGQGPFRMVLDTGASHSAVAAHVARELGISLLDADQVVLRGVTGAATVPAISVDSMVVGDLELQSRRLPIVTDALGGADGVLGTEGLFDKRIFIDFRHDNITIFRSHRQQPLQGYVTIPFRIVGGLLVVVDARVGRIPTKAIIDTGGQGTIGNSALGVALAHVRRPQAGTTDEVTGTTLAVQTGEYTPVPTIELGRLSISGAAVTIGDMDIFQHWHMQAVPAILIGMDLLGLNDAIVIDYRREELQVLVRRAP